MLVPNRTRSLGNYGWGRGSQSQSGPPDTAWDMLDIADSPAAPLSVPAVLSLGYSWTGGTVGPPGPSPQRSGALSCHTRCGRFWSLLALGGIAPMASKGRGLVLTHGTIVIHAATVWVWFDCDVDLYVCRPETHTAQAERTIICTIVAPPRQSNSRCCVLQGLFGAALARGSRWRGAVGASFDRFEKACVSLALITAMMGPPGPCRPRGPQQE